MKRKKMISSVLVFVMILSVSAAAFAVTDGFTMSYLPGTSDAVSNMPADDSGTGGQAYNVSDMVPQREGYEFLGWTLDYGLANTFTLNYQVEGAPYYGKPGDAMEPDPAADIREGSSVTLEGPLTTDWKSADGTDPANRKETYKVNYLEVGTDKVLAPQKVVVENPIGISVFEDAIDIDGYRVVVNSVLDLTIQQSQIGIWTFTGWCSDEDCITPIAEITNISADTTVYGKWAYEAIDLAKNEITFYYEPLPAVQFTDYIVRCIDLETGELIIPDVVREHYEIGSTQTEFAPEIDHYFPLTDSYSFEVVEGKVVEFLYYMHE